jgi:hypothetical protein
MKQGINKASTPQGKVIPKPSGSHIPPPPQDHSRTVTLNGDKVIVKIKKPGGTPITKRGG